MVSSKKKKVILADGSNLCETHPMLGDLCLSLKDEKFHNYKPNNRLINMFDWNCKKKQKNYSFFSDTYCGIHLGEKEAELRKKEESIDNEDPFFRKVTSSICSLVEYKNKKYGNAALEPLNIFQGKTKVGQRLDEKLARVKNSDALSKNDVGDLMGGLILVCKENGWDNFDEFKD